MSCHCLQEPEAGCLEPHSSDSGPSDTLNGMIIVSEFSPGGSKTASCTKPQSSVMSEHSSVMGTPQAIRDWLMSLPQASPVSHSVSQANSEARPTSATCGPPQQTLFGLSSHDSFCLKMCPEYDPICPWSSETCADLGMTFSDPSSLGLTTLERHTDENGCGYLHTPAQQEPGVSVERLQTKDGEPAKVGERAYDRETGRLAQVGLHQQIAMLRTPEAGDCQDRTYAQIGMLTTRQRTGKVSTPPLGLAIQMIPTPTRRDHKGGCESNPYDTLDSLLEVGATKNGHGQKTGLKLQPAFVEWLMGWPIEWTDLKPLEMDRFHKWLRQHGSY